MRLSGKVALLVGCGGGLGQAIASALAGEGADMAFADFEKDAAEEASRFVKQKNRKSLVVGVDVRVSDEVEDVVRRVLDQFGKIDVLVHNLSIATSANVVDTNEDDWDLNMDFNAKGAFLSCRAVARHMIEQGRGKIITISSMYGKSGGLLLSAYAASKAAVIGLTECLAVELSEHGICANSICVGVVDRRELELGARLKGLATEKIEWEGFAVSPMRTINEADGVAKLTVFLASDESDFMNGQALNLTDDEVTYMRSLTIPR